MKDLIIDRVEVYVCCPIQPGSTWTPDQPNPCTTHTIIRIFTGDGIVGAAGTDSYTFHGPDLVLAETLRDMIPDLKGQSAHERETLWQHFKPKAYGRSAQAQALIDVALWDIAAQASGQPLHTMLGSQRNQIEAYASTPVLSSPHAYVEYVSEWVEKGFKALKFHCWCDPEKDAQMVEAVHRAHGEKGLALILDVEQKYDLSASLRMGRLLSDYDYAWFEAPLDDYDLNGYQALTEQARVPILAAGNAITDPLLVEYAMENRCWSRVRVDAMTCGGITPALAIMRRAAQSGLNVELQSWGHSLAQAANLHLMLSQPNCTYFEQACEFEAFEFATANPIRANDKGLVTAPFLNGLGLEIDWRTIQKTALAHLHI